MQISRLWCARTRHSASTKVSSKEKKGKMTVSKAPHTNHQGGIGNGDVKDHAGCKRTELVWRRNGNYPVGFLRQQTRGRHRSVCRKKSLSFYNHSASNTTVLPQRTRQRHTLSPPTFVNDDRKREICYQTCGLSKEPK